MGNLLFLIAFLGLPIASFFIVRSLTWVVAAVGAALALGGSAVAFGLDRGHLWNFASLQVVTLVALLVVLAGAIVTRRARGGSIATPFSRQFIAVIAPSLALFAFVAIARLAAAGESGLFTAVGFLIRRVSAEDNAKWLDFTGQLVTGQNISQAVPMGGPLQLFMVIVATALAVVSVVAMGGVNQVFVAANSVVYAEFILAALTPFALAALAEMRVRARQGSAERGYIPAPLIWAGALVLAVGSFAVSGLGHLTFQFVFLVVAFWVGVFLVGTKVRHAYLFASMSIVAVAIVWFPLTPISLVVIVGGVVAIVSVIVRDRRLRPATLISAVLWLALIVLTWSSFTSTIRYMTDGAITATSTIGGGGGGGIRTSVSAMFVPALDLLVSQGGTEVVAPILAILAALSAVLGSMFIMRRKKNASRRSLWISFSPAIMITAYAIALAVLGTWWAGTGPAYGALKSTFLATIVILAVTAPLALMQIDARRAGVTLVRLTGIAVIVYLLTVDSLMPRALTYLSPKQWPALAAEGSYWAPAEVRTQAIQDIANNPVGCAFYPQGARVPTALPEGQITYSCTRILTGLAGADSTALPLVNWLRREWFTNTAAWDQEYPGLLTIPEDIRQRKLILMNEIKNVVGLETVQYFMDRQKPAWAQDGASAPAS